MLCCVPNCKLSPKPAGSQRSCFKFPLNKSLKQEWLRQIPGANSFKRNHGVCILHFEERFIKRSKENPLKGRLIDGAVPTIFLKDTNVGDAETDDVSDSIESDGAISSFETLKSELESKLQLDDWKIAYSETNLHIYKLMVEESGNLRVETSIHIDRDLVLKIFHQDKLIGTKFSKSTVHRSLKLKEWKHLQKTMDKFRNSEELKIHTGKIRVMR